LLLADVVAPRDLVGYVRGLAFEANLNPFGLSQFLPDKNLDTTEFKFTRGMLTDEDSATFRAWDTEAPIARRQGFTQVTGSIPPLSRKIPLGEETALKLRALLGGDVSDLARRIYDDAAKMTRAIIVRLERARGEALEFASITLNENGVAGTVTFGRDSAMLVTASPLWSSTTTADPVLDMTNWIESVYVPKNGVRPGAALISQSIAGYLIRNDKIRVQVGSLTGAPSVITNTAVRSVFDSFDLPPLFIYRGKARISAASQVNILSPNKVIFLPPSGEPLGNTFLGVTAEAVELVGRGFLTQGQASGITAVSYAEPDPVATWTKAAAVGLPVLANPDLTMVATVA
jgi:hypothetical protein